MMDPFRRDWDLELKRGDVVLVGEGGDDCAVMQSLIQGWRFKPVFVTRNDRSEEAKKINWEDQFRALVQQAFARQIHGIGLLFDAESNRKKTHDKLKRMFKRAELEFPSKSNKVHVSRRSGVSIKTAYHINPANRTIGALEALFAPQVRKAEIGECVEDLLKCYNMNKPLKPTRRDKVRVRTYLAYRNPSNTGLKTALERGFLSCIGAEFERIKRFVELLKPKPTELLNGLANRD